MIQAINRRDIFAGALLGLAIGDALGTTLEFKSRGQFDPITDMLGGGPFALKPGEWTDDTSMAMCLAESLVALKRFDAVDQMDRYCLWWETGYWSCRDHCFDIGNTVRDALIQYRKTQDPFSGSTDAKTAGNGCLMRLAPVPLFYISDPERAIHYSAESARTTHGAQTCIDACRYFGGLMVGAAQGVEKEKLLSPRWSPVPDYFLKHPLCPEIDKIAAGSFKEKPDFFIKGSGYVVESLEAALWAFYRSNNFRDGALKAVNLGDDADTTGAIFGQLGGAYYGLDHIPMEWLSKIAHLTKIQDLSDSLWRASMT